MSTRIIVFFLILFGLDCYSQLPFRRNFVTALDATPSQILEVPDGGVVILGTTNSCGAGQRDLLLIRTDIEGDTIWVKTYGTEFDELACGLVITGDTGFVLVGIVEVPLQMNSTAFVIRVDSVGDVLWSRTYQPVELIADIVQVTDGSFVLTGVTHNQPPLYNMGSFLLKIDSSGNIIWKRSFAVSGRDIEPSDISVMNDGGYLLSATVWGSNGDNWKALLIRTNANGNVLWSRCFQSTNDSEYNKLTSGSAVESSNGDCFICGAYYLDWSYYRCLFIMKLTPNGNHIWTRSYPSPILGLNVHSCSSLLEMSDGDLIASGASYSTSVGSIIIRTDSFGNVLYSNLYERLLLMTVGVGLNNNIVMSGVDYVANAEIGYARADVSGSIDCEQMNYSVLVTDSIVELATVTILSLNPPIVTNVAAIFQGVCDGAIVKCDSLGVVIIGVDDPASSDTRNAWVDNPVSDYITIHGTRIGGSVIVSDLSGRELMATRSCAALTTLYAADLASSLFVVRYIYGESIQSFRVVKF